MGMLVAPGGREVGLALLTGHPLMLVPTQAHDIPITLIALAVAGMVVAGAVRWPAAMVGVVIVVAPFHKVAVAIADKAIASFDDPAVNSGGFPYPEFLARVYSIDGIVIGGLLLGTAIGVVRRRRHGWDLRTITSRLLEGRVTGGVPLVALVAVAYVAVTATVLTHSDVSRAAGFALMLAGAGPAVMVACYLADPSPAARRAILAGVVVAGAAVGAFCLLEQWLPSVRRFQPPLNSAFSVGEGRYRSGTLLESPFEVAFYLAAVIPTATIAVVRSRGRARLAAGVAFLLIVAGLTVTFTRSAYAGAAAGALVAPALMIRQLTRRRVMVGAVALAAVATAATFVAVSALPQFNHGDSNSEHLQALRGDWSLIRDQPLGHGLGVIDTVGQIFDPNALSQPSSEDLYLAKGIQGGIPLMVIFVLALVSVFVTLVTRALADRRTAHVDGVMLCAAATGAMLAVSVAAVFLGIEDVSYLAVAWGVTGMALVATRARVEVGVYETEPSPAAVRAATI